ncbi:hypothetical protein PRK78_001107 [Emydomyces testavorans]|uniref:Uncharacterized protein n=1 Tax=Emydomyces testavorans TaxID=2070801 RepID=A0AAF0DBZ1_9EURO|nr:hypothetical protein PRK78_001107 [Emydomyces testavorans]
MIEDSRPSVYSSVQNKKDNPYIHANMSAESLPITPTAFAAALKDLTIASLYAKVSELRNSVAHLQRSNTELKQYVESLPDGDQDCEQAVLENEEVIKRMSERIFLVKSEVETRGQQWIELNGTDHPDALIETEMMSVTEDVELPDAPVPRGDGELPQMRLSSENPSNQMERNAISRQRSTAPRTGGSGEQPDDEPEEGVYI